MWRALILVASFGPLITQHDRAARSIDNETLSARVTAASVVQLFDDHGHASPWLRARSLLSDRWSICVDAPVEPWRFVTGAWIEDLDPRAEATVVGRNDAELTVARRADGRWSIAGSPEHMRAWFERHDRDVTALHRSVLALREGRYSVELRGAGWTKPTSRLALRDQLARNTARVGWKWRDISAVEIDRAIGGETVVGAESDASWLDDRGFWQPQACADADAVDPVVSG